MIAMRPLSIGSIWCLLVNEVWYCLRLLAFQSFRLWCACCSLASVKSKGKKKRKRGDEGDSDEAEEFSESDSELGKPSDIGFRFKTLKGLLS